MDSDVETVLSRRVRDKAVARFQILPLVGGEGDAVPVCYVVICPGLKQAFRTLLREAQGEAVTIITGPHVSIFQNIVTSVLHLILLWLMSSTLSLAFTLILCSVIFPHLFQFSVFYLLFPATYWNKNTSHFIWFFFLVPFFPSSFFPLSFLSYLHFFWTSQSSQFHWLSEFWDPHKFMLYIISTFVLPS